MNRSGTNRGRTSLFTAALVEASISRLSTRNVQVKYANQRTTRFSRNSLGVGIRCNKSRDLIGKTLSHVIRPARCVGVVWPWTLFDFPPCEELIVVSDDDSDDPETTRNEPGIRTARSG